MVKGGTIMEEKQPATIPYFAHEGEMYRMERINKRLQITCCIMAAAVVLSNVAWLIFR